MDSLQGHKELFIGRSILAVLMAILVFAVIWYVGSVIFNLWDFTRGISQDWLQAVFRELLVPGMAGYFSLMLVANVFRHYNRHIVFYGFVGVIALVMAGYVILVVPVALEIQLSGWDLVISVLSLGCAAGGAYYAYAKELA